MQPRPAKVGAAAGNLDVLSTVVLAADWLIVVGLSLRVIARLLPVGVSLAWLAVAFAVPFARAVFYLIFGGKRLGEKRVARQAFAQREAERALRTLRESPNSTSPAAGTAGVPLYRQALVPMGMPALKGNRMVLLHDYGSEFAALIIELQRDYLTHSVFVDADSWRRRPARHRFWENAVRLLGPLLLQLRATRAVHGVEPSIMVPPVQPLDATLYSLKPFGQKGNACLKRITIRLSGAIHHVLTNPGIQMRAVFPVWMAESPAFMSWKSNDGQHGAY